MLRALHWRPARGVRVEMILPERVDSLLTRYASRSYYDELLIDVGVPIRALSKGPLAHEVDYSRPPYLDVRRGESRHAEPLAQL